MERRRRSTFQMRHTIATASLACLLGCMDRSSPVELTAEPIVNGTLATGASHPYAVFLSMTGPSDVVWDCTGTLIEPDVVLTAAHCTVCATGVTAYVLGESLPGQSDGTQPAIAHPAASFSHNAAAFPAAPDCSIDDPEAWGEEISDKLVPGADLAVVHLATPSIAQPMPLLTHPPRGFNPRQDLFGQQITLVGRGWVGMKAGDKDSAHMRYGACDLDSWGSTYGSCDASKIDHEPWTIHLYNETWDKENPVHEAGTAPGDSGGPYIAKVKGIDRVIAVASSGFGVSMSYGAPVFTASNATYLRGALGDTVPVFDTDHDDIDDVADNCPGQANRDQTDRDEDGVGDLCDNCTPMAITGMPAFNKYEGVPAAAYAAFYNPDQANCNQEAELDLLLTEHPEYGSTLPQVTDTDYLLAYGEEPECDDGLVGARHRYLRGDACDPIPCARVETITTDVTDSVEPPGQYNICEANGYGIGACSYEMPAGFWIESITRAADVGNSGAVGLRFCECDGERDTALERRQNCGAATTYNCAIDGSMYSSAGSPWQEVSVGEVATVFGPDQPEVAVQWDFLADLAAWSGVAVPPPPWNLDDGHIVGGPDIGGVLWSRVAFYAGHDMDEPLQNLGFRKNGEIASWYGVADTEIRTIVHWREFPVYRAPFPWEYCGRCTLDMPWTWVLDVERHAVIGVGPEGAQDTGRLFDQVAVQLLGGDGLRVGASEPEYQLGGTSRREVVVDQETQLVIGALSITAGDNEVPVVGSNVGQHGAARASLLAPEPGSLYAYSAVRDELYALASRTGPLLLVWTRDRGWREMSTSGDRLLQPVAMTFRLDEGALYVMDRERAGAPIRLVRLDLDTGIAAVRDSRLVEGSPSAISLSNGRDGHLLVAAAFGATTRLARLDVRPLAPQLVSLASHAGGVTGEARETEAGVAFLVPIEGGILDPRVVSRAAFAPVRTGNPRPIFPR
jgi:hypothetical protein